MFLLLWLSTLWQAKARGIKLYVYRSWKCFVGMVKIGDIHEVWLK